jgi:putative spermidine/putrescine transport system permease protein
MRGAAAIEAFLLSPLLLPHAATALVLFWLIDRLGARGTVAGIALAHVILCLPFAYRPLAAALRHADRAEEEAAAILGAPPWRVFVEIVLPAARPALLTAFMFTLLLSFDEVTVTVFLVSIDRVTLPVAILQAAQDDASPLLAAVATMLIGVTVVALALVQRLAGLRAWSAALR